jgi:hypothetical protein
MKDTLGKVGNKVTIQHYMSSPNKWSNGSGKSHTFNSVAMHDKEELV